MTRASVPRVGGGVRRAHIAALAEARRRADDLLWSSVLLFVLAMAAPAAADPTLPGRGCRHRRRVSRFRSGGQLCRSLRVPMRAGQASAQPVQAGAHPPRASERSGAAPVIGSARLATVRSLATRDRQARHRQSRQARRLHGPPSCRCTRRSIELVVGSANSIAGFRPSTVSLMRPSMEGSQTVPQPV